MTKIHTQPNTGKRVTATIIDYTIFMTFCVFYIFQFGEPNGDGGYSVNGLPALIPILAWLAYFPLAESFNGQTIGHLITELKVVTINGNPITFGESLKRRLLDGIELFGTFGIIALITVKNTKQNQRVGDLWAKTIVVGGESASCDYCDEQLSLSASDTLIGTFICPACGKKNEN